MASLYGYATVAELQLLPPSLDYSGLDATLIDGVLEGWITLAERMCNSYTGTVFTGTIPDNINLGTLMVAQRIGRNYLIENGFYRQDPDAKITANFLTDTIKTILDGKAVLDPIVTATPNYNSKVMT